MKPPTTRQNYIRILKAAASAKTSYQVDPGDVVLAAQLIDDGRLDGKVADNNVGKPFAAAIIGITFSGQQLLDQLEREELDAKPATSAKKHIKSALFFVAGAVTLELIKFLFRFFASG